MHLYRKNGIIVGVLYIMATAAGVISLLQSAPLLEAPLDLVRISTGRTELISAAFFMFVMGITVAGTAIWSFPVLRKHSEALALAFAGGRIAEGILFIVGLMFMVLLLPLAEEFIGAGSPASGHYQTTAMLLKQASDKTFLLGITVFELTAPVFYYLMFTTRLLPRWLSAWGLVGIPLMLIGTYLPEGGMSSDNSVVSALLNLPIAIQEMVMAVWLILKGFDQSQAA